jgi:hypothetical protein
MEDLVIHQQKVLINAATKYQRLRETLSSRLPEETHRDMSSSLFEDQYLDFLRYQHRSLGKYYFSKSASDGEIIADILAVSGTQASDLFRRWTQSLQREVDDLKNSPTKASSPVLDATRRDRRSSTKPLPVESNEKREWRNAGSIPNFASPFTPVTPSPDMPGSVSPFTNPMIEWVSADTQPQRIPQTQSARVVPTGLGISLPPSPSSPHSPVSPISVPNLAKRPPKPPDSVSSARLSNAESIQADDEYIIRWRIKLDESRWEFDNDIMIRTNTSRPFRGIVHSEGTVTEIKRNKISRDALDEAGHRYKKITLEDKGEWAKGGKPRIREFWQIDGGLLYNQMSALVLRTKQIDEERKARLKGQRRSSVRNYGRIPRRVSTSGQTSRSSLPKPWSAYIDTEEAPEERQRDGGEKRSRRASFVFDDDITQYTGSSRKHDHSNRKSSTNTEENLGDRRERGGSKSLSAQAQNLNKDQARERDDQYRNRDRGKDSIPVVSAGLLALLGLSL